ncbi:sulfurtransferase [Congregibacter litoralis]|uniref:Rhodanese-related protein sulfurtransferase n=1 Tax=Congregibacter litoralis KT71 TaxID=314285 RepID=A4AAP8_9GAMM|nr:sulfurtransferase [Congregibacter litoralis]EAQ96770.1 Rhodanese-related protein sulfurtransferase [Congregibacter litoralis KT71]
MTGFLTAAAVADFEGVVLDCRFALNDPAAGRRDYEAGHIPGAQYLDLARDMSAPVQEHGGRHPLPAPRVFAQTLAELGIDHATDVLLYDDSRFVFAARCWWMMRALGYREPRFLSGGYSAWLARGEDPATAAAPGNTVVAPTVPNAWPGCCDRRQLAELQAQAAAVVDAREAQRYCGEHEPIDPVAGHIPGAINLPWQSFSNEDGAFLEAEALRKLWGETLDASPLVVYCGSGVSACVNVLSLALLGRDDVWLYGGSWSDWCSYL